MMCGARKGEGQGTMDNEAYGEANVGDGIAIGR